MKKYLVGLWAVCAVFSLMAQGGNMRFGLEGRIANATGVGIEGAKIELHILPKDSTNLVSSNTRLRQWLDSKTDEIYTTETNSEGLFTGVLSREVFQTLRAKGISLREAIIVVKADAIGYEIAVNLVKPEMQRNETGMSISLGLTTLLRAEERMEAVEIRTKAIEMKGDTAEMNANNYKVNPDASAEDLVRKMPGVVQRNGEIAQCA